MLEEKDVSKRYNSGKLEWALVHFGSLAFMVRVLMFGAKKYAPDNWKRGMNKKRILESLLRHLTAMLDGEEYDSESGLPHIGHVMCNAMFYGYYLLNPKKEIPYEVNTDLKD